VAGDPAVDVTFIVADLILISPDCPNEMKELLTANLAEYNLPRLDFAFSGTTVQSCPLSIFGCME
jgi:hypothetical protein